MFSDKESLVIDGDEWRKTKFITSISEEALKILNETNTYRVTDNLFVLDGLVAARNKEGRDGAGILEPKQVAEEYMITKLWNVTDEKAPYEDTYNGFLFKPTRSGGLAAIEELPEEDRVVIIKRNTK